MKLPPSGAFLYDRQGISGDWAQQDLFLTMQEIARLHDYIAELQSAHLQSSFQGICL